jgi:hypothetical protein
LNNQVSGKTLPNAPVPRFVRVRQGRSGHWFAKANMVAEIIGSSPARG